MPKQWVGFEYDPKFINSKIGIWLQFKMPTVIVSNAFFSFPGITRCKKHLKLVYPLAG
jgi:hypothetical protein